MFPTLELAHRVLKGTMGPNFKRVLLDPSSNGLSIRKLSSHAVADGQTKEEPVLLSQILLARGVQ